MPKPDKVLFTLKVAAENFPEIGGKNIHHLPESKQNTKIKVLMEFGSEFNFDLDPDTRYNANFNAKTVKSLLSFVSNEVITKVAEHLYKNELCKKYPEYDELVNRRAKMREKYKGKGGKKTISALIKNESEYSAKQLAQDEQMVSEIVNKYLKTAEPKEVTQVRYEKLSEGELTYSIETVVNGDLPPPRIPPMSA